MTALAKEVEVPLLTPRRLKESFEHKGDKQHVAIYKHIHSRILPHATEDAPLPPLHVLAYAIRACIQPTPILSEITTMLSMLGHADYIRRLFLGKLFEILEMDENQRESSDPDIGTLSEAEHERIERFADDMGMGMRKLYREAVVGWSLYHVYETWAMKKDVDDLLRTYFPVRSPWEDDAKDAEGRYIFHLELSDAERKVLERSAQICEELLRNSSADSFLDMSAEDLRRQHPRPQQAEPQHLIKTTLRYLERLEDAIDSISEWVE